MSRRPSAGCCRPSRRGKHRPRCGYNFSCMSRGLSITIDALSALLMVAAVAVVAVYWTSIPAEIPTHFNLRGVPDGWGGKGTLLFVAGACVSLFAALTFAPRYPHLINVPGERTERKLHISIDMLRVLKLVTMAMIAWIVWGMARGQSLGPWMLCFVAAIFIVLGFGFYQMTHDAR
ncbi:MAG: DUF1648 domain-containing protein [Acidobacteria bacterium]|nr:DUF1648 domain-containing protein [Acidobacteriota bacterium]